jgi:arabinose-5-phosphate isomerase
LLAQGAGAINLLAGQMMTKSPRTISGDSLAIDAFKRMEEAQITSIFVIDDTKPGVLLGLVRMHDLLAAKIV